MYLIFEFNVFDWLSVGNTSHVVFLICIGVVTPISNVKY